MAFAQASVGVLALRCPHSLCRGLFLFCCDLFSNALSRIRPYICLCMELMVLFACWALCSAQTAMRPNC